MQQLSVSLDGHDHAGCHVVMTQEAPGFRLHAVPDAAREFPQQSPIALLLAKIRLARFGSHWTAITTGQIARTILCGLRFGAWRDSGNFLISGKTSSTACIVLVELTRLHYL